MILRHLAKEIALSERVSSVVVVTGPRQSGKSTLVKEVFKKYQYVNLEGLPEREFAQSDPRGFIAQHKNGIILDEIQRVPELLSEIQVAVDENKDRKFILTGSENLLLSSAVNQSLAGRASLHTLYPFCLGELQWQARTLNETIAEGFYPRVVMARDRYKELQEDYISTYIERDVRHVTNIGDLSLFRKFLILCAGRIGQLLNKESLSGELGVSAPTIERWLSILEATYICVRLYPWFKNSNKRLVKMPKLYFVDTGIAANLLGIRNPSDLSAHPLRGSLFENFQIIEVLKTFANRKEKLQAYFYRDHKGNEVDLIIEIGQKLLPIEIKTSHTFIPEFIKGIVALKENYPLYDKPIFVLGGQVQQVRKDLKILPWQELANELVQMGFVH